MITTTKRTMLESMLKDKSIQEPCYLFDKQVLKDNICELRSAFEEYFDDKFVIAYSYKTNPDEAVLGAIREAGAYAEIVSPHERKLALSNGVNYENIIYNGVIPDAVGKFNVAALGGMVNLENFEEVQAMHDMAKKMNKKVDIGIRVNVDIGTGETSRFGFDVGRPEYCAVVHFIQESPYLRLKGIHSHIHGGRDLEYWYTRALALGQVAKALDVEYIDFGSNMYGKMDERLAKQFGKDIPTFRDYAKTIHDGLNVVYRGQELPTVIIEPGTPIVANAVSLVARIVNIREIKGKKFATADCSKYDLGFIVLTRNAPMDVIHTCEEEAEYENIDIYGYTCTEGDIVYHGYSGKLGRGDYIIFRNVGAYSNTMASSFIQEPFKVVEI